MESGINWGLVGFGLIIVGIIASKKTVDLISQGTQPMPIASNKKLPSQLTISQAGINAVKGFEGFVDHVYKDAAGYDTIGYGHLVKAGETFSGTISETYGDQLLRQDLQTAINAVKRYVLVPVTQGMFDSLTSFVYNLGAGNFSSSTLLKKLNAGDYQGAADEFQRWVYAGGQKVAGLVNRRNVEAQMFVA